MGRGKRRLLDVGEVIGRDLVELQDTYVNERELSVWPDLREVERIPAEGFGLGLSHDLDLQHPLRVVAAVDRVHQVALCPVRILAPDRQSFFMSQGLDALPRLEVKRAYTK